MEEKLQESDIYSDTCFMYETYGQKKYKMLCVISPLSLIESLSD